MRLWFADLILYSEELTLAGVYVPFTDIGAAVLAMLAKTLGRNRGDIDEPDDAVIDARRVITAPPYECPTSIAGLLMRSGLPFTAETPPTLVSSPYCADITSYSAACSGGITLLKHEPSAQIPWQNTILGFAGALMSRSPPS